MDDANTIAKIVLVGVRKPDISGSTLIFREIERSLRSDARFEVAVVDLSYIRGTGIKGMRLYAEKMVEAFKCSRNADAMLLFTIGSGLLWTLPPFNFIARITGSKFMVRCTGGTAHSHGNAMRQWFVRQWLCGADLFMVETDLLMKNALRVGLDRTNATPNGRHLSKIVRAAHEYTGRWVMISRLLPTKGVFEAVAAFRKMPRMTLDLVGPLDGIRETDLDLPTNVKWLGPRPSDEISGLLQDYDGFVFPTYYPTEGHAGVIIEALAAGLPVVSTSYRSIPELIDDTCGILVPTKDVDAIVEAVDRIDRDPELRMRLVNGAISRSKTFDWEILNVRFHQLILDVINKEGGPKI